MSQALAELPFPALAAEDVEFTEPIRAGAPLVVRVLVLARLSAAL
jgi:hypothetical protein